MLGFQALKRKIFGIDVSKKPETAVLCNNLGSLVETLALRTPASLIDC